MRLTARRSPMETTNDQTHDRITAAIWMPKSLQLLPKPPIVWSAMNPNMIDPNDPPTACTPQTSRASSHRRRSLMHQTHHWHVTPENTPITIEAHGRTKPEAAVMMASPATDPMHAPSIVGLPCHIHSTVLHATMEVPAESVVLTTANTACPPDVKADPPLNPIHPNQISADPSATNVLLWGTCSRFLSSSLTYLLDPTTKSEAREVLPAATCTTMPPAKSFTPQKRRKPLGLQIQCANGQ
mmetsp:Transcript_20854/g.48195  ORF Transcript_20854/g.48195 Transcript_20854/m.48195 type:complete len:241 (-) Transcript_20854:711-1433(-)